MNTKEIYEQDRYDLLHQITHRAIMKEWDLVEKYKALYQELYGPLPGEAVQTHPIVIPTGKGEMYGAGV